MAHSAPPFQFSLLLLVGILSLLSFSSGLPFDESPEKTGFRVSLTRVDAGKKNLTELQLVQRAIINRVKTRLDRLSAITKNAPNDDIQAPIYVGDGEFLMHLSIGTPAVPFLAIMDTGSDLIWTQCKPCSNCFNQSTPVFEPALSSSFSNVTCSSELCKALSNSRCGNGCEYLNRYGDESSSEGFLAMETLTFGESAQRVSVPNIGFGCGVDNKGKGWNKAAGLVGLGRGPLSLVSQLGSKKFSYCLTSIGDNKSSSLLFGSLADLNLSNGAVLKTTPLIRNPILPSFYYLSLEGITVGQTLLPIPKSLFQLGSDGGGGVILDSGTTITSLHEDAFDVLKQVFKAQTKLRVSNLYTRGLDVCFDLPSQDVKDIKVPKLVFHFEGLDLELPVENYMIADTKLGVVCLAMGATGRLSIFGNIQQQNMLVLHDLEKETVSFIPTKCDQL